MVYYLESVYGTDWVTDGQINYTTDQIAEGLQFIQDLEGRSCNSFCSNNRW